MNGPRTLAVDFDVYEVAFLAGGPRRAVDAAIVALVESGRVAVDRSTGQLTVADGAPAHPLEAAVLDAIGARGATGRSPRCAGGWRTDERLSAVRRRLERDGLLRPSAASPRRRYSAWSAHRPHRARGGARSGTCGRMPPPDRVAVGHRRDARAPSADRRPWPIRSCARRSSTRPPRCVRAACSAAGATPSTRPTTTAATGGRPEPSVAPTAVVAAGAVAVGAATAAAEAAGTVAVAADAASRHAAIAADRRTVNRVGSRRSREPRDP